MSSQKFSLQLHDRRYEEFNSRLPWETFPGEGQPVCGDKDESASALSSHLPGLSANVTLIKATVQILRDFAVILMFSSDSKARR